MKNSEEMLKCVTFETSKFVADFKTDKLRFWAAGRNDPGVVDYRLFPLGTKDGFFQFMIFRLREEKYQAFCATAVDERVTTTARYSSDVVASQEVQVFEPGGVVSVKGEVEVVFDSLGFNLQKEVSNNACFCFVLDSQKSAELKRSGLLTKDELLKSKEVIRINAERADHCEFHGLEEGVSFAFHAFAYNLDVVQEWPREKEKKILDYSGPLYSYPRSIRTKIGGVDIRVGSIIVKKIGPRQVTFEVGVRENNYGRCILLPYRFLMSDSANGKKKEFKENFWAIKDDTMSTVSPKDVSSKGEKSHLMTVERLQSGTDYYLYCCSSGAAPEETEKDISYSSSVVRYTATDIHTLPVGEGFNEVFIDTQSVGTQSFKAKARKRDETDFVKCVATIEENNNLHDISVFWHTTSVSNSENYETTSVVVVTNAEAEVQLFFTGLMYNSKYYLYCATSTTRDSLEETIITSSEIVGSTPPSVLLPSVGPKFLPDAFEVKPGSNSMTVNFKLAESTDKAVHVRCLCVVTSRTSDLIGYMMPRAFWAAEDLEDEFTPWLLVNVSDVSQLNPTMLELTNLKPSTTYRIICSTSTKSSEETLESLSSSSEIIAVEPDLSTLKNTNTISNIVPARVVRNTLENFVLESDLVGDGVNIKMGLLEKGSTMDCKFCHNIEYFEKLKRIVEMSIKDTGNYSICYSDDNGKSWHLQELVSLKVDATDPRTVVKVGQPVIVHGKQEKISFFLSKKLSEKNFETKYKVAYATTDCSSPLGISFLERSQSQSQSQNSNQNDDKDESDYFASMTFGSLGNLKVCYSDDYGMNWTEQITNGLRFNVYSSEEGPREARIGFLKFEEGSLSQKFDQDTYTYTLFIDKDLSSLEFTVYTVSKNATAQAELEESTTFLYVQGSKNVINLQQYLLNYELRVRVTAEDRLTEALYLLKVARVLSLKEKNVADFAPKDFVSGSRTQFSIAFNDYDLNGYERVGFVPEKFKECTKIAVTAKLSKEKKGEVILLGYEKFGDGKYKICVSNNEGKSYVLVNGIVLNVKSDESTVLLFSTIYAVFGISAFLIVSSVVAFYKEKRRRRSLDIRTYY